MKKILLTNDDGINAPGIKAAEEVSKELGELWIVAPESQRSSTGRGVTTTEPVKLEKIGERRYTITGKPADAVILARDLLMAKIDLCVSGVNHGLNLGLDAVMWSGTCGAAFEAASFGIPSIAMGMEIKNPIEGLKNKFPSYDFTHIKSTLRKFAEKILSEGLPDGVQMLNINVPLGEPNGIVAAPLGKNLLEGTIEDLGNNKYLIGAKIDPKDEPGTDIDLLCNQKKITVTPLVLKGFGVQITVLDSFLGKDPGR